MVTNNFLSRVFRASEDKLICWSRLHLQSLASTPVLRRVDVRQAAGRKNICQKHVVQTINGIRVGLKELTQFDILYSYIEL
jgi:hypothetical protein